MCLIGCISATNDTGVDNYKSIPTTSDIQQQDITPTTNTQNEIQTTNKAVESNKDPVASNVNENTNIKMDVNTQTTNTNNTLKSNAKKTADSKTVKQAAQKDTTKVKVTDITSYPGKTVQLKAQITSSKTVNSGTVLFKINGITYGQTSVSNGIATMNYHISSSFKNPTYTITAIYQGNDKFSESRANGTLHLNNVTKTSVKVTSITSYPGKTVQLKAQINSNKAVNTGKVAFKINGKTIGTTNVKNSIATIKYTIPSSFKNPTYTITAVYGQYGEFKESKASGTLYLESSQYKEYLTATKRCDAHSSYFKSIVNSVTSKISGTYNKAVALFNYANNRLRYSSYYNTRYGSTQTCKQAFGNCCDMAHVVIALMRTAGIPARYNHATCYFNSGLVTGHVWAEVYVNGKWYKCDTTSAKNSFGVIRNWYKCGTIKKYKALPF